MGKCKGRHILVCFCKCSQFINSTYKLLTYKLQSFIHYYDIRVITYIAGGCSQMYYSLCLGTLNAVRVYMAHNIMADFLFTLSCHIIIDIILMSLEFLYHLIGYRGKSQFLFCFCQGYPQSPPGTELHILREDILHFLTCIPFR